MKPENHDVYGSDGPKIEAELLLRFLITRFDDLIERDNPNFPLVFRGLTLSSVGFDEKAETEIRNILLPQGQMRRCKEVLKQSLARTQEGQSAEQRDLKVTGDYVSLPERACRQILFTAHREARRMIAEDNYEFAQILECMAWIALQCYPNHLKEFEEVWNLFRHDPKEATTRAVDVFRAALMRRDPEERPLSPSTKRPIDAITGAERYS